MLSSLIVLALFLVGRGAGQVVTSLGAAPLREQLRRTPPAHALPFFAVVAVAIQFVVQMNRMIGASVLGYFGRGTIVRLPKTASSLFRSRGLDAAGRNGWAVLAISICSSASSMT